MDKKLVLSFYFSLQKLVMCKSSNNCLSFLAGILSVSKNVMREVYYDTVYDFSIKKVGQ